MDPITLLLVDDHDIVRAGLKSFLEAQSGFQVVGEARNGSEALEHALETQPAIVLMDISMPGMDGLQATRLLKDPCPLPRCSLLPCTMTSSTSWRCLPLAPPAI